MRWIIKHFKEPGDPTRKFGVPRRVPLVWDSHDRTLNGIQFGDSAETVTQFGRAEQFESKGERLGLTFAHSGLFLEFGTPDDEEPGMTYIAILLGEDPLVKSKVPIQFADFCILPGGNTIDLASGPEVPHAILGPPYERDRNDEEDICFHQRDGIVYEFEFNPADETLKRINIFPIGR